MVLKYRTANGGEVHGPPYTPQEEAELYAAMATGPHRHASAIRRVQQPPEAPTQEEAN